MAHCQTFTLALVRDIIMQVGHCVHLFFSAYTLVNVNMHVPIPVQATVSNFTVQWFSEGLCVNILIFCEIALCDILEMLASVFV